MTTNTETTLANAMHAASVWLERIGADPATIVVVNVSPIASVGIWSPGKEHVGVRTHIDDAGSEVSEAVAPVVGLALEAMPEAARQTAIEAAGRGARLQALLLPAGGEFALRLVHGGQCVELCSIGASCTLQ